MAKNKSCHFHTKKKELKENKNSSNNPQKEKKQKGANIKHIFISDGTKLHEAKIG